MARTTATSKRPSQPESASRAFPSPFTTADDKLKPFLSSLDRTQVYITHIDPHPPAFKRQIFIVPVILNLFFVAALVWRAYYIVPWYTSVAQQLWAMNGQAIEQFYTSGLWSIVVNELRHFVTVVIDYALIVIVAPWPISFFVELPGNPVLWRWHVPFELRELIVRVSRGWNAEDLLLGDKRGDESPFWKTRVLPALEMDKIGKTGYLLMDKNYDLDFGAMIVGQDLIRMKTVAEADLNGKLLAFWKPTTMSTVQEGCWVIWDFRKELYGGGMERDALDSLEGDLDIDEGKRMIMRFKEKLESMGKEDLFYRWVELIQYESSRPGGFTKERQIEAGRQVQELFQSHGVDFEEFERNVGIKDGRLVDDSSPFIEEVD